MSNSATARRTRSQRAAPTIRCYARTDPAKDALRHALLSALSGNEFKAVAPLLESSDGFFKGTVPQHATASGLSLWQCKRARRSLKAKGVITIIYNGKRANRGLHDSTVTLTGDWDSAQRKRVLISTKSNENNEFQSRRSSSGPAISTDISDDSSSSDINTRIYPPSERTVVASFSRKEACPAEESPTTQNQRSASHPERLVQAAADTSDTGDATAGLALTPLRAAAPAVAAEPAPPEDAGRHPDWMKVRTRPWALAGDDAADFWQEKTGEQWTRREHKMFKDAYHGKGDLPALLAWSFDHWDDIVAAGFSYMTRNRPPSKPSASFMCASANAYKILELYENWLDVPRSLSDKVQSEQKSIEWRAERDAAEDRDNEDERREREQFQEWQKEPEADVIWRLFTTGRADEARKLVGPQTGSWRDGPHAAEARSLIRADRIEEALKLISPATKSWRDGPNAKEIGRLFTTGRADEARKLIATVEPIEED